MQPRLVRLARRAVDVVAIVPLLVVCAACAADAGPDALEETSEGSTAEETAASPSTPDRVEKFRVQRERAHLLATQLVGLATISGDPELAEQTALELSASGLAAAAVVVARPVSRHVEVEELGGEPFPRTYVTLEVDRVVAGQAPERVELSFWGGEYAGRYIATCATAELEMGTAKVFLLSAEAERGPELLARNSGYEVDGGVIASGALRLSLDDYSRLLTEGKVAR